MSICGLLFQWASTIEITYSHHDRAVKWLTRC